MAVAWLVLGLFIASMLAIFLLDLDSEEERELDGIDRALGDLVLDGRMTAEEATRVLYREANRLFPSPTK